MGNSYIRNLICDIGRRIKKPPRPTLRLRRSNSRPEGEGESCGEWGHSSSPSQQMPPSLNA
jgi:hypothetical protein